MQSTSRATRVTDQGYSAGPIPSTSELSPVQINWPDGKRFAFTAFDDADYDRLHNVKPVYDFLRELGIFTTKSIWPLAPERDAPLGGLSTENPEYLAWTLDLQRAGFEIGYHGARCHSSNREATVRGLAQFREQFGHSPRSMSNHFQNVDSIYWGSARLTGLARVIYQLANVRSKLRCEGHIATSPYFWGDLCRDQVGYVRNFVFREINTLKACPIMPYHDSAFPYVRAWYASSEGGDVDSFVNMLAEKNQDQLASEGGACIMYTHFAKGFFKDGRLDARFERLMKRLAGMGGWFVPVSTLLDYLSERMGGVREITAPERNELQWRWLLTKLRYGSS